MKVKDMVSLKGCYSAHDVGELEITQWNELKKWLSDECRYYGSTELDYQGLQYDLVYAKELTKFITKVLKKIKELEGE